MISLRYSPRYFRELASPLQFQFLFCQLWYLLFSALMLAYYILPIAALFRDQPIVNVTYPEFTVRFSLPAAVLALMVVWWHRAGWSRPATARLMSWEAVVFLFCRWPWCLWGVTSGVWACITGSERDFRITPKGSLARAPLPLRVVSPYIVLSVISALCMLLVDAPGASGFYVFTGMNALIYAGILMLIVVMHEREGGRTSAWQTSQSRILLAASGAVLVLALAAVAVRVPTGLAVLLIGTDELLGFVCDTLDVLPRSCAALGF